MKAYIKDLLNSNSRLIIPDFGAFIVKQKNPRIIVFNEFLRYNDGLLIDFIADKEKIEKESAKEKVNEFVKEIRNNLNNGKEFQLPALGMLAKDASGKIVLLKEDEIIEKKEIKKEKPLKKEIKEPDFEIVSDATDEKKIKPEKEKTLGDKEIEKPKVSLKTEKSENKVTVEPEKEIKEEKKEVQIEKKPEVKPESVQPVVNVERTPEVKRDTVSIKKPEPEKIKVQERPKEPAINKKAGTQYVLWILLILIVNGLILSWFVFNDRISNVLKKSREEAITSRNVGDKTTETQNTEEVVSEEPENVSEDLTRNDESLTKPVYQVSGEKKYYIVAGCFRDLNNANSFVNDLKSKGYDSQRFGKIGSLHAVSYGSFSDKNEATVKLREIRRAEQKEAWIIYY